MKVVQDTERFTGQDSDAVQLAVEEAQRQYNEKLIASTTSRQYESAVLPSRQLGQHVPPTPFSARQQRQSKFDGQLERDGKTRRELVTVQEEDTLAHIARERRVAGHDRREPRQAYSAVPLTGCQLSTTPAYQLPQTFEQAWPLAEDGELEPSDVLQLAGAPWEFETARGILMRTRGFSKPRLAETCARCTGTTTTTTVPRRA